MSGNVKDHEGPQSDGAARPGLTAADLDRIHALHLEATPLPWKVVESRTDERGLVTCAYGTDKYGWGRVLSDVGAFAPKCDVRLSIDLRNALPSLIALARRGLEAERSATAKIIDGFDGRVWEYAINLGHGHPADMCPRCNGVGRRAYAATSTWRGGAGGSTITTDACDACWGSGDKTRRGADLRGVYGRLSDAESKLAAALAEVERVRGRLEKAEAGLKDFVEWGLRADLHPTRCVSSVSEALRTEQEYLDNIDAMVRERARDALASAAAQTKAVKVELAPHRAECEGGENCICQRRPRAQTGQAAKQGGEGRA